MVRAVHLLFIALLFAFACNTSYEQSAKVEEKYPSGEKKIETVYEIRGGESVPVEQKFYTKDGYLEMKGPLNEEKQRHGKWQSFYKNDQLQSVGHFKNGEKHGETVVYFQNGQKRYSGRFKDGKRHGKWRFWNEEGKLLDERTF